MRDIRYFTWYIHTLEGDQTTQGPVHVLDRAYEPRVVRVHAKRAPDAGDMTFDIKDDGESIFPRSLPRLMKGQNLEEVAEDFTEGADYMARYSLVSLDLANANGAAGITVILECEATEDDEYADGDT